MLRTVLLCDTADEISTLRVAAIGEPDLVVEVTSDALRAIEAAARARPDVVVCRLSMEGFSGTELLARIGASSPDSRVVVRVSVDDVALAASCLADGARGVIAIDDDPREVMTAVHAAAEGGVSLSPRIARAIGDALIGSIDATERLGAELEGLRDSVAQGTSAKADFLSNISHELRTPVTVAKGIAYVLNNPSIGEDERTEFLGELQGSLDKLMGLVDEIITMSELERGTFELRLAEVDLAPAVDRAVAVARDQHPTIRIEASITAPLRTLADEERLEGVVAELLDNACRYSPDGMPVHVSARSMSEGIVVSVTDRGEGLDRTVAKRSFDEPFSTGEGVLRKEKAGVGVGLHLARQLVVEHGGTLWTDPLPGGGTRASFCIPPPDARGDVRSAGAA
ncbi:MAG: ATP-binding protein [Actinomycetota bacterium]